MAALQARAWLLHRNRSAQAKAWSRCSLKLIGAHRTYDNGAKRRRCCQHCRQNAKITPARTPASRSYPQNQNGSTSPSPTALPASNAGSESPQRAGPAW